MDSVRRQPTPPAAFRPAERWLVFATGERCRVWAWPVPLDPGAEAETSGADPHPADLRYVVFDSERERGCARLPPGTDLDTLTPRQLLNLYERAQRFAVRGGQNQASPDRAPGPARPGEAKGGSRPRHVEEP